MVVSKRVWSAECTCTPVTQEDRPTVLVASDALAQNPRQSCDSTTMAPNWCHILLLLLPALALSLPRLDSRHHPILLTDISPIVPQLLQVFKLSEADLKVGAADAAHAQWLAAPRKAGGCLSFHDSKDIWMVRYGYVLRVRKMRQI